MQEQRLEGWPHQKITCPPLILQGTLDESVPLADSEYAHARIPGSLIELTGADHMMSITMYKKLDESIVAFLRVHPANF